MNSSKKQFESGRAIWLDCKHIVVLMQLLHLVVTYFHWNFATICHKLIKMMDKKGLEASPHFGESNGFMQRKEMDTRNFEDKGEERVKERKIIF